MSRDEGKQPYQWSRQDKVLHLLPAIPLIVFYAGAVYLLAAISFHLVGVFVLLWIATNVAVAGICAGCPYRGGYCPGLSQLYFAPFLSALICKGRERPGPRAFKVSLAALGVFGVGSYLFVFYWLFVEYWPERAAVVLILLGLLVLHMPLSFFILCPKCSYNDTCPMAKVQKVLKKSDLYRNLPRLETPRLVLRALTMGDVDDIFAYASDEEVTRFLRWGPHRAREETECYIGDVLRDYKEGRDGPWAVEHRETGRVVGSIHLMSISARRRKAEVGFVLSRAYWSRGLMSEALRSVLAYSFETLGLNRVEAFCIVENRASIRVLEKVGMRRESVLQEYLFQKGAFRDFVLYAMLKRDYEGRRAGA